jgi:hypothetical protein
MSTSKPAISKRSILQIVFISPDEKRLRSGWRLLLQTLLMAVLSILLTVPVLYLSAQTQLPGGNLAQIAGGAGILLSIWIARKFLDRRTYNSLGVAPEGSWLRDTLVGIGIAALIMALAFVMLFALGWLRVDGFLWQTADGWDALLDVLIWLGIFLAVGYYEEVLSRGYHLQNLADGLNLFWGVAISSSVFGALHLTNPNASIFSTIGITAAGVFLAYGYLRTGKLWLSIGLHIGWNFFQGVVFGFPVSGLDTPRIVQHSVSGPEWFTGGSFGPEAGLLSVLVMIPGALLIWLYTRETTAWFK